MAHIWAYLFLYVFSLCKYIFVLYITKLQPHYVYSCACFLFITCLLPSTWQFSSTGCQASLCSCFYNRARASFCFLPKAKPSWFCFNSLLSNLKQTQEKSISKSGSLVNWLVQEFGEILQDMGLLHHILNLFSISKKP